MTLLAQLSVKHEHHPTNSEAWRQINILLILFISKDFFFIQGMKKNDHKFENYFDMIFDCRKECFCDFIKLV